MLTTSYAVRARANPEHVWQMWENVEGWPQWDTSLKESKLNLNHKFEKDAEGTLTNHGAPQSIKMRITECTTNKSFCSESQLPLGTVIFDHQIVIVNKEEIELRHTVSFKQTNEQTKTIFEKKVWPQIIKSLPPSVDNLAKLAREATAELSQTSSSSDVLTARCTAKGKGTPEKIWNLWTNVENWSSWDTDIKESKLNPGQKFVKNAEGSITNHGAPRPLQFRITECLANKSFRTESELPFGSISFDHEVSSTQKDEVQVTHIVSFKYNSEKSKELFEKNIFPQIKKNLEPAVNNLIKLIGKKRPVLDKDLESAAKVQKQNEE